MVLYINTIKDPFVLVEIRDGDEVLLETNFEAKYMQAEKLLPAIDQLLQDGGYLLKDISKILVENFGGTFSSLRIGVVTANALGYSLDIPVIGTHGEQKGNIVAPIYDREPNIG